MIHAVLYRLNGDNLSGFEVKGHAGGKYGQDILCSAVSSACYLTANVITEIIKADAEVDCREGFMSVLVDPGHLQKCQDMLRGLLLHLTELEKQYPNRIEVIYGGGKHAKN